MAKKKPLLVAAIAVAAALAAGPRIARALSNWDTSSQLALLQSAQAAVAAGADGLPDLSPLLSDPSIATTDPDQPDDATIRRLAMAAEIGPRPPEAQQYLINLAAQESIKWADPAVRVAAATVVGTRSWKSLGPLAARSQFNGTYYKALDSGRLTAIAVSPANPYLTFIGTSGGGVWVADLKTSYPSWQAITDGLGALAIGAIAIDPNYDAVTGKVTIWLGLGDFIDQQSGVIVKGTYTPGDAAGVWNAPITLGGSGAADGFPSTPLNVRQIRIDPNNTQNMFVGTDDGFYKSTDGGASFQIVPLPTAGYTTREGIWEIHYLGNGASGSNWLISGVYACPTLTGAVVATRPPAAQTGTVQCTGDTGHANLGDLWKSTDGGATWTSIRASGALPPVVTQSLATEVGRIAFATGPTTDPTATIVYAQASTIQETPLTVGSFTFTNATSAYLKSTDGGTTWTRIATGLNLTTPATTPTSVTNPTFSTDTANGCQTMNIAHGQAFYNLSVSVDPGDPNRAIFGGDLCSAITVDGGATFQLASHWLPQSGAGQTAKGFLQYAHADWHVSLALRIPGESSAVILAGTDGGLSVTRNIWDVPTPELGAWSQPDVGLATHLFYGIGTGDPTLGNPNVVFGGLQDNGTRWRLVADEAFVADFNPGNWDQIIGGDGIGAAVSSDTNGQSQVYWASVNGSRRFCVPRAWDCSQPTRIQNGVESANWRSPGSTGIADPFLIRYDPLGDDSSGVASANATAGWVWSINQTSLLASVRSIVPNNALAVDGTTRSIRGMGLRVSPYRYTLDGKANSRIYGGVTTSGTGTNVTAMGSFLAWEEPNPDGSFTTGRTITAQGIHFPNVTGIGTTAIWIGNGSDFAAPQNPASLGGTDSKKTWLASSNSVLSNAVNCTNPASATCDPPVIIPPFIGHIYKTVDGGVSWTAFHGNGTGFDLPNFPVYVMRYDPSDTTDQTIWVGTDFGVYRTTDGGNTWAPYGSGLPAVRITDIRISNNGSLVRVATYGRGVWEIYPKSEAPTAAGTGDFNGTKVIDFFNLASLAARMGSTPSLNNNLPYDSAIDLDGNSTVDETDLSALVAKFGSTLP